MKKFKMFGLTLLLMFVGLFSVSAADDDVDVLPTFSDNITNGEVTYTNEAGTDFSYQIVKVKESDFSSIESDVESLMTSLEEKTTKLEEAIDGGDEAEIEAASQEYINVVEQLIQKFATVASYNDANWNHVGTAKSGKIAVDVKDAADDDVYVVWIKSDEIPFNSGVSLGAYYDKDGIVNVPTVTPSESDNQKVVTATTSNVKNPKTGVNLPIAAGIVFASVAGISVYVIRRNKLFKQI